MVVAVGVAAAQVAGAEPAHAVGFDEGLRGGLGVAPVTAEDLRPADPDFAHLAVGQGLEAFGVDHAGAGADVGDAQAAPAHGAGRQPTRRR